MTISNISKKFIKRGKEVKGQDIREGIFNLLKDEYPDFDKDRHISIDELRQYRRIYLTSLISQEKGEVNTPKGYSPGAATPGIFYF